MKNTDLMETLVLENQYKIVVSIFGVAYAAPNIKAQKFYTDLGCYHQC